MSKVDGQQPPDTGGGDSMLYDDTGGWGVDSGPLYIYLQYMYSFIQLDFISLYVLYTHIIISVWYCKGKKYKVEL